MKGKTETSCNASNVFITTGRSPIRAKSTSYSVATGPVPSGIKHSELEADFYIHRIPRITMYMTFNLTYATPRRCVQAQRQDSFIQSKSQMVLPFGFIA
jgi:hypothetical protein